MLQSLSPLRRCKVSVSTVAVSRDGRRCLWAGGDPDGDCAISVCDVATNKVVHRLAGHKRPVVRARFLVDGSVVSFSFDSLLCRWTSTGDLATSNSTYCTHRADGFAVSSDGLLAVAGDYHGEITGWHLQDGSRSFAFREGSSRHPIWALALEPGGTRLLAGSRDGKIRAWALDRQHREYEIDLGQGHHVQGLAWHPGGSTFAAAIAPDGAAPSGSKSRILIFDAANQRELGCLFPDGHQPLCCAFSPDGRLLAAAGGGNDRGARESGANCVIHVWDSTSGQPIARLAGHTGLVRDLVFSPDSRWLLSAGWDSTVRSWRLESPPQ